ncbi:MAG: hypothetical protein EOO28_18720 [Comamonadaceae bacterium]|nr:MAG: hypothetical protein EOO28_18720 [Comamonadaceae bacterium]
MKTSIIRRHAAALSILAASLVIGGCASTPAPTLITLPAVNSAAPGSTAPIAVGPLPVLALARVDAPEYVVSRRVRYRTDASTLAEWPDTYWAERIEISLSRELVAAMRGALPGWSVCDANCGELAPAMTLRIVIDRMDYFRGEKMLRAKVRMITATAERPPSALKDLDRSYEISANGDSAQAQAKSYSDLLARVAADATALVGPPVPARPAPAVMPAR